MESVMKKRSGFPSFDFTLLRSKKIVVPFVALVTIIVLPVILYLAFEISYINKVYPNVYVGNVSFAGRNREESIVILDRLVKARNESEITFKVAKIDKTITIGTVGTYATYDVPATVDGLLRYGRQGDFFEQLRQKARLLRNSFKVTPIYAYNRDLFDTDLANAIRPDERPVINSELSFSSGSVYLTPSQSGYLADRDKALGSFESYLAFTHDTPEFSLEINDRDPAITIENASHSLDKAKIAISRSITLKSNLVQGNVWTLDGAKLFDLLSLQKDPNGSVDVVVEDYKVASYSAQIGNLVNREPIDAKFQVEDGKVAVFEPAQNGVTLDSSGLTKEIAARIFDPNSPADIEVPVKTTEPALSTANVNNYNIKELVGQGKSKFRGSAAGRIHNLSLASNKLNGTLIAPGETFSMYKVVGEVEKSTGFQDAFIIKDGRTVPGVGGGLCQVSTTLFRAALNAGLPIKERHQHAYRVYYYEQDSAPGIDAAVYFPSWDLKFVNDTGNYLLLQTKVDTKTFNMEFNLYGVKDGRTVSLTKPVVTNLTPPPPDLRVDDPTLARGQENEVEHAVWGANVSFNRTVKDKDGNIKAEDVFKSAYKAWQKVVMVGVKDN
jgi:vancomycin resistance protein YoaR